MHSPDDVQYALEATRVLYEPDRRIDTFGGDTRFEFLLLSELMDTVGQVRIRTGEVEALRPQIIRPEAYNEVGFEGFGDGAQKLYRWMEERGYDLPMLKYGFQFKRGEVTEELLHEPIEEVRGRVLEAVKRRGNPMQAVIEGVDDTWEISVLRFTFEMVEKSRGINLFDFKRRGML